MPVTNPMYQRWDYIAEYEFAPRITVLLFFWKEHNVADLGSFSILRSKYWEPPV
jgi:hypothetical protein